MRFVAPLSIFLSMLLLSYRERRLLTVVVLAVGTVSVFIGLLQVAQGPESSWRFFAITNPTEAVGFFANRNHFAALGYTLVLFAAAFASNAAIRAGKVNSLRHLDTISLVPALAAFCLLIVLLSGEAMARSRAGLSLTMVALFGAFALGVSDRRVGSELLAKKAWLTPSKLITAAMALALVLAVQFALYRILQRFEVDPLTDARISFIPTTLKAALAYLPFGSGLGTFVPVYAIFEKPQDTLLNVYANHAHNDAAELFLETGLIGVALAGAFLYWLGRRALQIWRSMPAPGARDVDWSLARAATLIIALILVHSLVDYPLRTGAMTAIVALCCGLLTKPLVESEEVFALEPALKPARRRHAIAAPAISVVSTPIQAAALPPATPSSTQARASDERWGGDVEWPEAWRDASISDPGTGKR